MKRYLYLRIQDGIVRDHKLYTDLSAAQKRAYEDSHPHYSPERVQVEYDRGLALPTNPGWVQIIETEVF